MTAPDGENIDVTVDLEDNLSRPAREAAEEVDNLGDQAKQADRRLAALQRQADKTGRSLELMALKTRAANMEFENNSQRVSWIADEYKKLEPQVKKTTRAVEKQTKEVKKNSGGWSGFRKILARFSSTARGVPKQLFAIGKGLGAILAVASSAALLQNIFSIIQALSSLGALAAFLPTAISSLASTLIVLKVATSGVGDAIGAAMSGNVDKLNAAMKNLSPSAQDFVMDIEDMSGAFKNLKKSVQENFFKPFAVFTKPVIQETIVPITHGMRDIAKEAGYATAEFLKFFRTLMGQNMIRLFFKSGQESIQALTRSITPMLRGISAVMAVIEPFWTRLTQFFGDLGVRFGQWLEEISRNGQLKQWIETAIGVLKQLGAIIGQVFGIFKGLINVLSDNQGLTPFLSFLQKVNEWVNSSAGQEALLSFFSSLTSLIDTLAPILKIVAEVIGNTLAPAILGIVQGLAPGFITFLQALADALEIVAPYLPPLAAALGQLLAALAPLLEPIAEIITLIAQHLTMAFQILAPIIGEVVKALVIILRPFLEAMNAIFKAIQPYIPQFTALIVQLGQQITPIITQIANVFSEYLNKYLEEFVNEILPELMPMIMELTKVFGEYLLEVLKELQPYIPQIAELMIQMMENSAQLWPVILQLAIIFFKLMKAMIPIGGFILKIGGFFLWLGIKAAELQGKILEFIGKVLGGISGLPGKIGDALSSIPGKFFGVFKKAYDKVKQVIDDIKSLISNANIGDLVSGAVSAINPFRFAGGPVEAGKNYTVGEIGKEMFVPKVGSPQVIGSGGMDTDWRAPSEGTILPNYMLKLMESNSAMMRKHAASQEKAALPGLVRKENHTHYHHHEGDSVQATFTGNMTADVDIERAMNKFYKDKQREDAERR